MAKFTITLEGDERQEKEEIKEEISRAGIVPPSFFVKNFKKELTRYKPWYIIYAERRCTINGENKKEPEIKRADHRNQSSNLQAHHNY